MSDNKETKQARALADRLEAMSDTYAATDDRFDAIRLLRALSARVEQAPAVEAGARDERVSMIQTLMLDWINAKPGDDAKAVWNRIEEKLAALTRASERALIVRWQEVVKFDPLKSTPTPYSAFEATFQAIYQQQAIREVRLQWVDEDGDQPTLLHMIEAAIAAQAGSKEGE